MILRLVSRVLKKLIQFLPDFLLLLWKRQFLEIFQLENWQFLIKWDQIMAGVEGWMCFLDSLPFGLKINTFFPFRILENLGLGTSLLDSNSKLCYLLTLWPWTSPLTWFPTCTMGLRTVLSSFLSLCIKLLVPSCLAYHKYLVWAVCKHFAYLSYNHWFPVSTTSPKLFKDKHHLFSFVIFLLGIWCRTRNTAAVQ